MPGQQLFHNVNGEMILSLKACTMTAREEAKFPEMCKAGEMQVKVGNN